ncbi:hypothetical protein ML462_02830 [Gramella lutea]|uniref:Uncharacterized protein n=1 Tax=Christiangramia lutea TaxID=1607951 RepID=A0A9X1V1F0_9FLAO|nr:hypothetical protein [Christiangramia lutea]MCH4822095.1 hypothetical protein [Christiangramia lutea]
MKVVLLPNYFKKIGIITGLISSLCYFVFGIDHEMLDLSYDREVVGFITKDMIVISLLFIAFAKEKSQIQNLDTIRFEKLKQAMIFGAVILIYDSISEIIFRSGEMEMESGYEVMITGLLFYIVTFYFELYNLPKEKDLN